MVKVYNVKDASKAIIMNTIAGIIRLGGRGRTYTLDLCTLSGLVL